MLIRLFFTLVIGVVGAVVANTLGFTLPPVPVPTPLKDYRYALVDAPREDERFPCLPRNPS